MQTLIWKHKILTVIVASALLPIAWGQSATARGRLAAEIDVGRGHYVTLGYGLPPAWLPSYAKLLRDRYGIEHRDVAGCTVSQSLRSYADGYNAVSGAAIKRKYKHDVLLETAEEAQRDWVRLHSAKMTPENRMEELFPNAAAKARNPACFRSLASGITMYEVVQKCGRPDDVVGSGVSIFRYHMNDGGTVWIGTPYLSRVDQVTYVD